MHEERSGNLPPGQQLLRPGRWPPVGEKQPIGPFDSWALHLRGLFSNPRSYDLQQLLSQTLVDESIDIHCVTRWTRLGGTSDRMASIVSRLRFKLAQAFLAKVTFTAATATRASAAAAAADGASDFPKATPPSFAA